MRNVILLVLFAGFLAVPAQAATTSASDLRHAQRALSAGKYEKAYAEYLQFAEKGNPLAQFSIALFYDFGWGRPQDKSTACTWFEKAAQGDIPAANHFFGECVAKGIGRPAEPGKAITWYQRAANLGHYLSWCSMADLYINGQGVAKDPVKAISLCQQAAERDIPLAQVQTGLYYLQGDTAVKDYDKAAYWLHMAAQKNIPKAQYYLGVMLQDGLGMDKNPAAALAWFELAAGQGYVPAYFPCGKLYFEAEPDQELGKLSEQDLAKAYLWLSAAEKGSKDPVEVTQSRDMLGNIKKNMPETWVPDLDAKVAAHFKTYPPLP